MLAISTFGLSKCYGARSILQNLTLTIPEGVAYGLVGPNGAGKSTLLHMLLGLIRPDRGTLRLFGQVPGTTGASVGFVPEHVRIYGHVTPVEYLHALGTIYQLRGQHLKERCQDVLTLVGLQAVQHHLIKQFSKGMLQRLGLAQALIHEPRLLLLDEPGSGLAIEHQQMLRDILFALRQRGQTIVLCSHTLSEVDAVCDTVGVLVQGQLCGQAQVRDVRPLSLLRIRLHHPSAARLQHLQTDLHQVLGAAGSVDLCGDTVAVYGPPQVHPQVMTRLADLGVAVISVQRSDGVTAFYQQRTLGMRKAL